MKSRPYVLTYLAGLVIGAVLCLFYNRANIFNIMVIIIGALLIIPAIIGIGKGFAGKKDAEGNRKSRPWYLAVGSVAGIVAGVLLIVFCNFFVAYLIYTLGVILILAGIVQLLCLSVESHDTGGLQRGWYCMPWVTILAGVLIICIGPEKIANFVTLITGIVLVLYGLNGLFSVLAHRNARKKVVRAGMRAEAEAAAADTASTSSDITEQ